MKVLHLDCSPRVESYSRKISAAIMTQLSALDPNVTVIRRDLGQQPLAPIATDYAELLASARAMNIERSDAIVHVSEQLITEVEQADVIVIGTSVNNFTVPATFKTWIDYVLRVGRTIGMSAKGKKIGLLQDKPVLIGIASGGFFTGERGNQPDFIRPYLTAVFECIGLKSLQFFPVQATAFREQHQLEQELTQLVSMLNVPIENG